jgi:hypothetical protein
MSSASELDIKVVYAASGEHRRARRGLGGGIAIHGVVGFLNLLVAAALCYVTCWVAGPEILNRLLYDAPLPVSQSELNYTIDNIFKPDPAAKPPDPAVVEEELERNVRAGKIVGAVGTGWLGLSSFSAWLLALSAGAAWQRGRRAALRRYGLILAAGAIGVMIFGGMKLSGREGVTNLEVLRYGVAAALFVGLCFGLVIGRGGKWFSRLAGFVLVLAAAGSVAALLVGREFGMVDPAMVEPIRLITVFVAHAAYGLILLILCRRM